MVKNTGGNKAKKFASKSFNVVVKATRFASINGEVYAVVTKMLGGSICEVLCIDGITRQCIIRRKFSGKGKRDNWLCRGKWILIGLRDWENKSKAKETCDLLEVYSDNDKEKLIKNSKENFRIFLSVTGDDGENNNSEIEFINSRENDLFEEDNEQEQENNEQEQDQEDEQDNEQYNEQYNEPEQEQEDNEHYKINNKNTDTNTNTDTEDDDDDNNNNNELDPPPVHRISSILKNVSLVDVDDI
jgi:initiation factor 1A